MEEDLINAIKSNKIFSSLNDEGIQKVLPKFIKMELQPSETESAIRYELPSDFERMIDVTPDFGMPNAAITYETKEGNVKTRLYNIPRGRHNIEWIRPNSTNENK